MASDDTVISIEVPEGLIQELEPYRERLAELLEAGLRTVVAEGSQQGRDAAAIMEALVSRPMPEEVTAFAPSSDLQERVSTLLGVAEPAI